MRHAIIRTAVLLSALTLTACNNDSESWSRTGPTQPTVVIPPPSPPTPSGPLTREIRVGQVIEELIEFGEPLCTFGSGVNMVPGFVDWPIPCRYFVVTAPADGTLVAELTWTYRDSAMDLYLRIEEFEFPPAPPNFSSLIGRAKVTAGRNYALTIGAAGYDLFEGRFVLTTRMEK